MEERDRWGDEESVTKTTYRKRKKSKIDAGSQLRNDVEIKQSREREKDK